MKIKFVSDLHFEINAHHPVPEFIAGTLDEILIVAGDTIPVYYLQTRLNDAESRSIRKKFDKFVEQVSGFKKIIFIMGNHEHYHYDISKSYDTLWSYLFNTLRKSPEQFYLLENSYTSLNDKWVVWGATLWTDINRNDPIAHDALRWGMNDFRVIQNEEGYVFDTSDAYRIHNDTLNRLKAFLGYMPHVNVIVATHHAPHFKSEGDRHKGSSITAGYCSDLSELILDNSNIKYWIHGHTHNTCTYDIGETTITSFQRGYVDYGEGKIFNKKNFDKLEILI